MDLRVQGGELREKMKMPIGNGIEQKCFSFFHVFFKTVKYFQIFTKLKGYF